VLSPANGVKSSSLSINFWWEPVKGAIEYRLQVVRPGFSAIQSLEMDTVVKDTKFSYSFRPGSYEWRIRAVNGSSNTDYFVFSFSIDSTLDISKQKVQLESPKSNTFSNLLTQTFQWTSLYLADRYTLEIWQGGNVLDTKSNITKNSISYTFSSQGTYQWRVYGQNSNTNSQNSDFNILTIDTVTPGTPVLKSPADKSTFASTIVTFSWTRTDTTASSENIVIYSDSGQTVLKNFITTLQSYTHPDTLKTPGNYFWKVRSVDNANNYSEFTKLFKFTIQ
jgi:hypothetical protein